MKKLLPIVLVVVVLAGIGWYVSQNLYLGQELPLITVDGGNKFAETAMPVPGDTKSVIGSIRDAMGLGTKMKCTYSDKGGSGVFSTVFVDGQRFKFTTDANGTKMYGVFDGETQYMWTAGKEQQGFKMTKACTDELAKMAGQTEAGAASTATPQDFQESFDNAQNVRCEPAGSEDFSIPADITFVDQCAMLRDSMKALEGIKGQLPAGVKIPGY